MNVPSFFIWALAPIYLLSGLSRSSHLQTIINHQQSSNSSRYHIVSLFHSLLHIKTSFQNSYKFIRSGSSH
ncbi:hypothetical protein F5882DRAFT_402623 [Hyaloscypha sp. PMI_1271]|nr:hypothetical protein F5882DRAFT_402623 [Hyaloscypha sp. PMI_1271]